MLSVGFTLWAQFEMAGRASMGADVPLWQQEWWEMWDGLRDVGWSKVKLGRAWRFVRPGCASAHGEANVA